MRPDHAQGHSPHAPESGDADRTSAASSCADRHRGTGPAALTRTFRGFRGGRGLPPYRSEDPHAEEAGATGHKTPGEVLSPNGPCRAQSTQTTIPHSGGHFRVWFRNAQGLRLIEGDENGGHWGRLWTPAPPGAGRFLLRRGRAGETACATRGLTSLLLSARRAGRSRQCPRGSSRLRSRRARSRSRGAGGA
jgi:hypothetical protein